MSNDVSDKKNGASAGNAHVFRRHWFQIRGPLNGLSAIGISIFCIVACFALWWMLTRGATSEERIVSATTLPSPQETFAELTSLWSERNLLLNTWVTLRRVALGFLLAAVVGIPLGVLVGCFAPVAAFFAPLVIFGRNIPIAALVPLTFFFFGIGESQKVLFIFLACVAFIISDTANSIRSVGQAYIDTAYTLGASRWQVIMKVLVPLAMPTIFDSMRLLFGLAFGYIMLAETIKLGSEEGGLGNLIWMSQRRGPREHIYLIILIIPIVALFIDRILFLIQRQLFPFRYGGKGLLLRCVDASVHCWESMKGMVVRSQPQYLDRIEQYKAEEAAGVRPKYLERSASKTEWRP
ncbi:MAG TPA: ABC transporter permease [Pirellulaceae bacterium]|nr:ABC transporter permease [Pirellulaceae bacterium]HMO92286.1 ABC transporter permease [Pirellulaceae bacterium]HMP71003.1 ABC transporter permease [Pirellulaceae bacterium]